MSSSQSQRSPDQPFEWVELSCEEKSARRDFYYSDPDVISVEVECVRSQPGGVLMPKGYADLAAEIYNFLIC